MEARFDGQVAVITGAGGGLGRAYALAFASRGAKVVVNDLGVALAGDASDQKGLRAADAVVEEIRKAGGEAVANYDDVLNGDRIIETAIQKWGRIDILVNNAGILRDVSFGKMTERDWDRVILVHVKGAFVCTKAAWPHMMKQGYGRIINTASASGLYGNFGQTNYGAAKMALVGMTKTLAMEGAKYNILVNCIAPLAGTRMTESVLPPVVVKALKPECVAPVVLFLASKNCPETGQIYEVGAGWVAAVRWQRSPGKVFPSSYTLEDLTRDWKHVVNFETNVSYPASLQDSLAMASQQISTEGEQPAADQKTKEIPSPKEQQGPQTKSAKIFGMIAAFLEQAQDATSALKQKVNSCFHFEIVPKQGQPAALKWTIDLRQNGGGQAMEGIHGKADATFIVADDVFASICLGQMNPQVAFLQGKMKIRGSMSKATKFTPDLFPAISAEMLSLNTKQAVDQFLKTIKPSGGPGGGTTDELSAEARKLKSAQLFPFMKDHLNSPAGAALVKQVNCIYRVDIIPTKGGNPSTMYINLKQVPPTVRETPHSSTEPFDCCFILKDDVFFKVATGKMNPQMAYLQGKMKIKGSTQAAMKFTKDLFPKISKL